MVASPWKVGRGLCHRVQPCAATEARARREVWGYYSSTTPRPPHKTGCIKCLSIAFVFADGLLSELAIVLLLLVVT